MRFLDLIEMIAAKPDNMLYIVRLEELPKIQVFDDAPREYKPLGITFETMYFHEKDAVIGFLSDKEIFGWEVKGYDFLTEWNRYIQLRIDLFKYDK